VQDLLIVGMLESKANLSEIIKNFRFGKVLFLLCSADEQSLKIANIVRFREVYKTKKGKLCIVMDYADGGDLQTLIKGRAK
jgi:serine/threonine protein kinase